MAKPLIWKYVGFWWCHGNYCVATGHNPSQAYDRWKDIAFPVVQNG